jgi:hypothetical protein
VGLRQGRIGLRIMPMPQFARSLIVCGLMWCRTCSPCAAQTNAPTFAGSEPDLQVLSPQQWQQIDAAVDRGLEFIAGRQQPDGSFEGPEGGQPGITGLCIMAFLSRGHVPGEGRYGEQLRRAIEFTLSTQHQNGLLSVLPLGTYTQGRSSYNHGIAGLMLGEVYGMTTADLEGHVRQSVVRALKFSREVQTRRKRHPRDKGGWRYLRISTANDSDLTATCWHLMFYRSAKNAGFEVPVEFVEEATEYVRRCYTAGDGAFVYALENDSERYASGATVAGGIISLAMAGEHNTEMAQAAGRWILRHPFADYNRRRHPDDRYHYSAYYCSQAMFQLGGGYWEQFYPDFQQVLLENQNGDGSWEREAIQDGRFGNVYSTALGVLALTPPYQLLPIYQR